MLTGPELDRISMKPWVPFISGVFLTAVIVTILLMFTPVPVWIKAWLTPAQVLPSVEIYSWLAWSDTSRNAVVINRWINRKIHCGESYLIREWVLPDSRIVPALAFESEEAPYVLSLPPGIGPTEPLQYTVRVPDPKAKLRWRVKAEAGTCSDGIERDVSIAQQDLPPTEVPILIIPQGTIYLDPPMVSPEPIYTGWGERF